MKLSCIPLEFMFVSWLCIRNKKIYCTKLNKKKNYLIAALKHMIITHNHCTEVKISKLYCSLAGFSLIQRKSF